MPSLSLRKAFYSLENYKILFSTIFRYYNMDEKTNLNQEDKRTLGLSSLGGALEFYDFVIYVFYAKIIG